MTYHSNITLRQVWRMHILFDAQQHVTVLNHFESWEKRPILIRILLPRFWALASRCRGGALSLLLRTLA
jgi:hypothetical protein